MQTIIALKSAFASNLSVQTAFVLIVAVLLWATGAPIFLKSAKAASFTLVSDTLTDSDLGVTSGHRFQFTVQTTINDLGGADTIVFNLAPDGAAFTITDLDVADFTNESGLDVVSACGVGADDFTLATTSSTFTLTTCTGEEVATSTAIAFTIASSTSIITNPAVNDDYRIHIESRNQGSASSILDQADTRVMILDDVLVTASVNTTFTFTVAGLASGTSVNGDTTSTSTSATAIGFGTLVPDTEVIAGQRLNVTTNAAGGFAVTVKQDQNLTSATGADIDPFLNGNGQATPIAWTQPANTLGSENTYGHFGITSEDSTLNPAGPNGADAFGTQLYAGNFSTSTLEVFYHNGPADGTTADIGETDVAYQIEIRSLQEAGTDYTATLTYVATPIF